MKVYVASVYWVAGREVVAVGTGKDRTRKAAITTANNKCPRMGIVNRELVLVPYKAKDIKLEEFELVSAHPTPAEPK